MDLNVASSNLTREHVNKVPSKMPWLRWHIVEYLQVCVGARVSWWMCFYEETGLRNQAEADLDSLVSVTWTQDVTLWQFPPRVLLCHGLVVINILLQRKASCLALPLDLGSYSAVHPSVTSTHFSYMFFSYGTFLLHYLLPVVLTISICVNLASFPVLGCDLILHVHEPTFWDCFHHLVSHITH